MGIGQHMAQIAYDRGYRAAKKGLDPATACTYQHTQARRDEGRWGWWHHGWHDAQKGLPKGVVYWDATASAGNALKVRHPNHLSISFKGARFAGAAGATVPDGSPAQVAGDFVLRLQRMVGELNGLPGVQASMRIEIAFPDEWPAAARAVSQAS